MITGINPTLVLSAQPSKEPVTLEEARAFLRDPPTEHNALVAAAITAARQYAENRTRRQLITATAQLYLDAFPSESKLWDTLRPVPKQTQLIELPRPPIQTFTSVKYYDADNALQTLAGALYQTDLKSEPARLMPVSGEDWPDTYDKFAAVVIEYICGYGDDPEDVPEGIRSWMQAAVTALYMNPSLLGESDLPRISFLDGLHDPFVVARA